MKNKKLALDSMMMEFTVLDEETLKKILGGASSCVWHSISHIANGLGIGVNTVDQMCKDHFNKYNYSNESCGVSASYVLSAINDQNNLVGVKASSFSSNYYYNKIQNGEQINWKQYMIIIPSNNPNEIHAVTVDSVAYNNKGEVQFIMAYDPSETEPSDQKYRVYPSAIKATYMIDKKSLNQGVDEYPNGHLPEDNDPYQNGNKEQEIYIDGHYYYV